MVGSNKTAVVQQAMEFVSLTAKDRESIKIFPGLGMLFMILSGKSDQLPLKDLLHLNTPRLSLSN
jgi:hypothetical protein